MLELKVRPRHDALVQETHRRRSVNFVLALLPALTGALLLLAWLVVLAVVDPDPFSPLTRVVLVVLLAVLVALNALVWLLPRTSWYAADVTVGLSAGYASITLATALNGTPYPIDGISADYGYKVEAIARFTSTWANADFSYKGLPAFYPPLQSYLGGRGSALFDLAPMFGMKVTTIATTFLVPLLAYTMWKRVVPRREAALLTLTALVVQVFYQTDSWVALVVVVPFWLDVVFGIRQPGVARRSPFAAGLIGALLFLTYYYYFFIMAVTLPLLALLRRWHPFEEEKPWRYRLTALITAGVLSSVYWFPLVLSLWRAQEPMSMQNLWFQPDMADLPLPMFVGGVAGGLQLLGLLHLALTARRDRVSGGLATVLLAAYTWYLIGLGLAALGKPVLVMRTDQVLALVLALAGVRALLELSRLALVRWPDHDGWRVVVVATVALSLALGQTFMTAIMLDRRVADAHNQPLPSGQLPRHHTPAGRVPTVATGDAAIGVIRSQYRGEDPPVVLTNRSDVLAFTDFYAFNQWTSHYAHPAAEFRPRLKFLRRLSAEKDPGRFAQLATENRFDRLDAFVLRTERRGLRFRSADDAFPYGSKRVEIFFERSQFDPAVFTVNELPGYVIAVRR